MAEITASVLLALIRDLDVAGGYEEVEYLEISRWNADGEPGVRRDEEATAVVRQLARERLGTFALADIGAAALAEVDTEEPRG